VQNSWGRRWSRLGDLEGVARWRYEDWFETVKDAWVLRLAISSPEAFRLKYARNHKDLQDPKSVGAAFVARRQDVVGHFLHIDDGNLVARGRYAQEPADIEAMIDYLSRQTRAATPEIDHVLFIAHGALQRAEDVAARVKAWCGVFLQNRIYPIHLMWETGFNNQVVDVVEDLLLKTGERMEKGNAHVDDRLEDLARPLGRKLWRDLKVTARLSACDGQRAGQVLCDILAATGGLKLHFLSQSAGVLLFARFLDLLKRHGHRLESGTMMAPACSLEDYEAQIRPHVGTTVKTLTQYSLIKEREMSDSLGVYGKSLLYLVSNAIEARTGMPLLGLEEHVADYPLPPGHRVYLAGNDRQSDAKTHRGFDADRTTMKHLLATILGARPKRSRAFRDANLTGY
jgi:hypothetical protein